MTDAWFDLDDAAALVPRDHCRAPWRDGMLHGRLFGGIVARAVEADHGDPDLVPVRTTVDMFRFPPLAPVLVRSERVRDGGRVRIVDVSMVIEGDEVARARVLLQRTKPGHTVTDVWRRPPWDMPHPDDLGPPPPPPDAPTDTPVKWRDIWQMRTQPGRFIGGAGEKRAWMRDAIPLVAGEHMTPYMRAANSADIASPLSNSGPSGLDFINADFTLHLARLPRSEWIGYEVITHESDEGVSVGSCVVYDLDGPVGLSSTCAVVY